MNYWIFQSNPCRFPIIKELENTSLDELPTTYNQTSYWHIPKIPGEMKPGDRVFIWKSSGQQKDSRGIYAKATIVSVSPFHREPLTPEKIDKVFKERGLLVDWIHPEQEKHREKWPTVVVKYRKLLLDNKALKVHVIEREPRLRSLLILRSWRRTLYRINYDRGTIIERMTDC
jgi:predicted RNA-binding protein with PUA-like domain